MWVPKPTHKSVHQSQFCKSGTAILSELNGVYIWDYWHIVFINYQFDREVDFCPLDDPLNLLIFEGRCVCLNTYFVMADRRQGFKYIFLAFQHVQPWVGSDFRTWSSTLLCPFFVIEIPWLKKKEWEINHCLSRMHLRRILHSTPWYFWITVGTIWVFSECDDVCYCFWETRMFNGLTFSIAFGVFLAKDLNFSELPAEMFNSSSN